MIPEWKKRILTGMGPHIFKGSDPIRILNFLDSFQPVFDTMEVQEGVAIFLVSHFMIGTP